MELFETNLLKKLNQQMSTISGCPSIMNKICNKTKPWQTVETTESLAKFCKKLPDKKFVYLECYCFQYDKN